MAKSQIKSANRRGRRTNKEKFLDEVKKKTESGQRVVNSETLRSSLDWESEVFNRVKGELIRENIIVSVRGGPGGSVALVELPSDPVSKKARLFISYSHADEAIKDELIKHISPLKRLNLISEWHDRKISAGDQWREEISNKIEESEIIVLIVSIDFINSQYCYDIEMERALERQSLSECVVIPVIARSCMWQSAPFAELQALPTNGKAITSWGDRDEALTIVADGIKRVAERLIART